MKIRHGPRTETPSQFLDGDDNSMSPKDGHREKTAIVLSAGTNVSVRRGGVHTGAHFTNDYPCL